jgi:hypothetical protein
MQFLISVISILVAAFRAQPLFGRGEGILRE